MLSKDLRIEIRPIPNRNGIRQFSENLEFFSQAHTICPLVDSVTRKYITGLSQEDIDYLKENNFPYDVTKDDYINNTPHELWENPLIKVSLTNSPSFLYPGRSLIDFVKYKYLLKSKFVYSSEEEMAEGSKPQASHYIYDETEAVAAKATRLEEKNNLILKVSKLSPQRKRDIILIILNENTENKNDDYLTVRFDDIVNNPETISHLKMLLDEDIKTVTLLAEVKSAIQKNVLRRTKQGIFYFETNLGFSEEEVKSHLEKPENQELYLNIKSKI